MGKLFGFETGNKLPKRRRKRGKVAATVAVDTEASSADLRAAPNHVGKYMIVHESETILGQSAANATPLFWVSNDDSDASLLELINRLPGSPDNFSNVGDAVKWALDNDFMVVSPGGLDNVPGGDLVLYFDPDKIDCYPGVGNILYDLSGNGNNATLYNSPTFVNGCIEWNGTNEYAQIAFNSNMAGWAENQTIVMWLKHDYTSGRRNPWDQAYGGYGTWTHEQGNNINNYYGDAGRNARPYVGRNSSTTPRNKWNLIVSTRDTSRNDWYINGVNTTGGTHGYGTLTTDTNNVRIGRGYAGYWQGKMGPVIAYDRKLTASEVLELYYGGPIVTDNLVLNLDAGSLGSFDRGELITYNLHPDSWNVEGSNYSGELVNGPSYSQMGGGSWDFDGSNDFIRLDNNLISAVGGTGNRAYTLEAWIYVRTSSGTTTNADNILGHQSSTGFGMQVGVSSGKPRINYGARSTSNFYSSTFEYNEWKHVVLSKKTSSNYCYTYLDGEFDGHGGTRTLNLNSPSNGDLTIGGGGGRVSGYLDGHIAIVRIYSKALSAEEVQQNFLAQKSRFDK